MDELLARVLYAHGGLERWSGLEALTARLSVGGPFWGLRGFPDALLEERLELNLHREHPTFTPWIAPGQSLTFDVAPERVTLLTADGKTVDGRTNPRSSYAGYNRYSAWDALQVGYFLSYAMWNYSHHSISVHVPRRTNPRGRALGRGRRDLAPATRHLS